VERDLPADFSAPSFLDLWTDASSEKAGIVIRKQDETLKVISTPFSDSLLGGHIYVKEAVAFHMGCVEVSRPQYQPLTALCAYQDNTALFMGLLKGRSQVHLVNDSIIYLYRKGGSFLFQVGWVSTHCMLADFPSRDRELPSLPLPKCQDPRCIACSAVPIVPRWMAFVAATSSHTAETIVDALQSWPGHDSSFLPSSPPQPQSN